MRRDLFTLVAASFSLLMVMMVWPQETQGLNASKYNFTFLCPMFVQKVGLFVLKRIESAYMSRYGVNSVVHGESDTLFSNLVTSVAEIKTDIPASVEMSNIATIGVASSFQKFEDIQGMLFHY